MVLKFTIVTAEFVNPADYPIGIVKDGFIREEQPTAGWCTADYFQVGERSSGGAGGGREADHAVFEIQMPTTGDILGLGDIIKVEIIFKFKSESWVDAAFSLVGIVEIPDNFDEGGGTPGWANWTEYIDGVSWTRGDGACKSRHGIDDVDGEVFDTYRFLSTGAPSTFTLVLTEALNAGDKKRFAIFTIDNDVSDAAFQNDFARVAYYTKEFTTASSRPILKITYRSYPPEGFLEGDDKLRIEPNPDNPIQPILTWGAIKADDFFQYKLYRSTSPITSVNGFKSAITVAAIATDKFTIAGEHGDAFPVGSTFKVTGSSGNDGRWTVKSVVESGTTVIETEEDITDAIADGHIHHGIWTSIDSAIAEFIDTFAHVDNSTYYYKLIAEDQDNHEDEALLSAPVFFTKPDVTSAVLTPATPNNVGTLHTMTVVSPQNIKKLYIDWDDGSTSWYEYETVGTTKTATHIYSKHSGAGTFTGQVRVQDEKGFWSALQNANAMEIDDTAPEAKLLVNAKKAIVGDDITLNASLSQPQGSNTTIAKYEFKRHENDAYQDNGTDPVYEFATTGAGFSGAITEFADMGGGQVRVTSAGHDLTNGDYVEITGTTNYDGVYLIANVLVNSFRITHTYDGDDATGTWYRNGTVQAALRITTDAASGALQDTDTVDYEFEAVTPTEITPGITGGLSIQTAIHELPHKLTTDKVVGVPIDSAGVAYEYEIARQPERFTIHATTEYPSMEDDIGIIRDAWLNNSYLRLTVKTEMETKDVRYDFKLDGDVSLGHITDNKITWSFPVRVLVRTEVAKPKVKGDITVWANPGGGKVTATSAGHGLSVGHTVLITGTINYNGTYVITNVTANTFRFVATWVANDAMGLWRKVGVS